MMKHYLVTYYRTAILGSLLLMAMVQQGLAQTAAAYSFSNLSGTYTYLSGGTSISAIEDDDATSGAIPIGFSFTYMGTAYTNVYASSNGWLSFVSPTTGASTGAAGRNNTAANLANINRALMPLWDDHYGGVGTYKTTGSSPGRVFTIEFRDWYWDYSTFDPVISFQVRLYESTNVIQFQYKRESGAISSGSATIGIGGGSATDYLVLSGAGAAATASSTTFNNSISAKPPNGQIFQFNPPVPCSTPAPGATIASTTSVCLGTTVNLSITSMPTGTGNTFQWQSSPDGITYTNITGATAGTYSTIPLASTYYKCVVTCATGPSSTASTPVYVSFANPAPTATGNSRCGVGTVSLSASTGSSGTLRWYSATTGGTSLGSGTTFTTPSIGTTTTYYVGLESESAGTAIIGSGASNTVSSGSSADEISPFDHYYGGFKSQYLFTAAELKAAGLVAGNITAVALDVVSGGINYEGFNLNIGTTSASALTSSPVTGLTNVYTTTAPAGLSTPASGLCTISFSSPYNWDGTSNLVLEACWSNNNTGGTGTTVKYDATSFVSHSYYQDDSRTPAVICGATSMSTLSARPRFTFNGNTLCSSPRNAAVATVNTPPAFSITTTQTVCNNTVAQINVTSTIADYNTYTWSPVTNLFTDAACTVAYTAGTSATTVYVKSASAASTMYKAAASNTTSLCTNVDSSRVTTLPASASAIATPESICVSGAASLALNPATGYGTATFQWQESADNTSFTNITSGGTAATYTTPTLTATKYYRAVVKSSAGVTCITSVSDTAKVNNPAITATTPASRCGAGTLTLGAAGSDGTLKWYTGASGGSSIASGTSYTTPSLAATTTYYVESESKADQFFAVGSGGTTLGTSTGDNALTPFSGYYEGQHSQFLVLAADLSAAGLSAGKLDALSLNVTTKYSTIPYTGYTIKLAPTTATSLSALITPTFTTVYGPASYTVSSGTNTFNFSSGFTWDGTSNIVMDVCFSNDPGSTGDIYSSNDVVEATTKSYTATYGWYQDNSALCGTTGGSSASSSKLPVITFKKNGCRSARTAVTATINTIPKPTVSPAGPVIICEGYEAKLTATGGDSYQWRNETGNIPGAVAATYNATVTGKYKVVATTAATGCFDSSVAVMVNVNPSPTVSIKPVGTTTICADSSQMLTSEHTGSGITFQWYKDAVAISGATRDSFRASLSGAYTIIVSLGACADTSNIALLHVNPLPDASFTITSANKAICKEGTIELTAATTTAVPDYQWSLNGVALPGATSKVYTATSEGVYAVYIRDGNNCRRTSDTQHIFSTPMLKLAINPKDVSFCEGTIIKLYNNGGSYALSYAWSYNGMPMPSDTGRILSTGKEGMYTVTVSDVYGCVTTSPAVSVTVFPLPAKPPVYKDGVTLSTDFYHSYQWYRNDKPIAGATARRYTMSFDGKYHVVVGNEKDCYNTSDPMNINKLGVATAEPDMTIDIYPNPSRDIIYVDAPLEVNLYIRDLQGRQLAELRAARQADISGLADGMYLLLISDREGRLLRTERIVKRSN